MVSPLKADFLGSVHPGLGDFLLNICSSCGLFIERISRIVHKTFLPCRQVGVGVITESQGGWTGRDLKAHLVMAHLV